MKKAKRAGIIILILSLFLTSCTVLDNSESSESRSSGSTESIDAVQLEEQTADVTDSTYRKIDDIMDKGPVKGGELNLFTTKPDTFNPLYTKNSYVKDFLGFVYESLTKLNEKQEVIPALSDKWTVSSDGLVWNFHIRTGVNWQDGKPLTATDVEFSVNSILSTKTDSQYKVLFKNVATFAAVDNENFKIVLSKPNSFLAELMCFPVIPKHQFQGTVATDAGINYKPVGTGPFSFEKFEKNKSVTLGAFRNWWYLDTVENPEQLLYVDNINIKVYESSKDAINAFQTSDIDVAAIDASDIGKYFGRTDLIIKKYSSRNFEFLAFNLSGKITEDVSVRNAINKAIDRKSIISGVLNGYAVEADVPVNPDNWLFGSIQGESALTDTPNSILTAAGWKKGENYYYKVANGIRKDLKLEILVANGNAQRIKIADRICEQLNAAGISAAVVKMDWDLMMQRITTKKYDIAVMGLRTNRIPDISFMYSNEAAASFTASSSETAWNVAGYNNNDVNLNLQKILLENNNDMKKIYFENAKKIISADMPYIGLFFLDDAVIYRKNVRGKFEPNIWDKYYDITKWYIPSLQ